MFTRIVCPPFRQPPDADEQQFHEQVETMADQAFDAQCTGANPRYPFIRDLKELYILAYRGCRTDAVLYDTEVSPTKLPILISS